MSTKIESFKEAQRKLQAAEDYFKVFDVPGHMNQKGTVVSVKIAEFTIYHQAYAGATNYHEADESLRKSISEAVRGMGETIRRSVISKLKQDVATAAAEAKAEADAVLAAIQT